jgi:hypothetical protein
MTAINSFFAEGGGDCAQSESAESMFPSPSSSKPLLQISDVGGSATEVPPYTFISLIDA